MHQDGAAFVNGVYFKTTSFRHFLMSQSLNQHYSDNFSSHGRRTTTIFIPTSAQLIRSEEHGKQFPK